MKLADFSVKRPVTIAMMIIAIIIFGIVSLPKLNVDLYPELNLPVAVVVTSYPGATPTEVENLVTKPLEESLATVSNIKDIQSISIAEASQVIILFNWGTNMDQATLDMREKADLVSGRLPDNANSPRVLKLDPNSFPVLTMTLSGSGDITELKSLAEDLIKPRLERIEGVASLGVSGGKTREIKVVLNPAQLQAYGLSIDQISQALQSENFAGSAGAVYEGSHLLRMRVDSEFKTIDQIEDTPIRLSSGATIPLHEVAQVIDDYKEVNQKTFLNQEASIGLTVTKSTGGNTVKVADAVLKELDHLKELLPPGVEVNIILDLSKFIKMSINSVAEHALVGGLLAVVILLMFLNSARSTLVVAITIPISVVATFCLMYFTGQSINMITLGGLTLGLGSLVDFAVVVLENIYRHRQMGKNLMEAAVFGAEEVGTAVVAAALAQIVVFVPIVFVEGLASELFGPLALTIIYSHIAALFAAITLVPMMASKMLKKVPSKEEELQSYEKRSFNPFVWFNKGFYKLTLFYKALLRWALNWRKTVIIITIGLLVVSIMAFPLIGFEFMPEMDQGEISVSIELPTGTKLADTEKITKQVEEVVLSIPERDLMYTMVGGSNVPSIVSTDASHISSIQLILVELSKRTRSSVEVAEELRERLKDIVGAKITVAMADNSGGGTGAPIQLSVRGDNLEVLKDISDILVAQISKIEGTRNVKNSLQASQEEYLVTVDKQLAAEYGLSSRQVLSALRTAFDGQTVTQFRTGEDEIDVRLMYDRSIRDDKGNIDQLMITAPSGAKIPLSLVAQIDKRDIPPAIYRFNQTREIQITGDIFNRDLGSISNEIHQLTNNLHLPDGYFVKVGGQAEDMAESFGSLGLAVILAIVLVYMVMASQFESLFYPFVIMFSIPPTFIGVVVGLLVTGHKFSVSVFIGLILLVGVVVNNAIVLIDYVNILRRRGYERVEAILEAGPVRLRPIMMTSLTTILAVVPMAFGGGEGNEGMAPMAVVVIFGLTFSTLITLVLVPVVYSVLDDWINRIKGWFRRIAGWFTRKKDREVKVEGNI